MIKVLVVDDSIVFRTQISSSLKDVEGVEVVGTAANGKIALQKLEQMQVDLVTLDLEMPEMGGIETLKAMREKGFKTKVIIFSSQTVRGAEKALEALRAGANDIVLKPSGDSLNFDTAQGMIREALIPKVIQFINPVLRVRETIAISKPMVATEAVKPPRKRVDSLLLEAVVIASSTGGPNALEAVFDNLKGPYRKPIFIAQHMPPVFTEILAKRLSEVSGADIREAKDGEKVEPNRVYVAPGDWHMFLRRQGRDVFISLTQDPLRNSVRPAADHLFESASAVYGRGLLGVVLTGMGEDGAAGAGMIRSQDGAVVIQNKESCVVFGMPGAVFQNNDYDEIGDLKRISEIIKSVVA